ncbi:hypothetical protein [Deinococcus peraridilitoris]|uniref:Uncharacterized protein n=1 Tax=Deinococcus peraridilitoris (strain DSM 19664 / LMG 22246 / CIP 109416 / KR-200) TaxID=937777 RepID=L0A1U9_DEIPD|nr:hypothetical protein [Deinococcus peraridilitoris]AFZ67122.1 hypothetical protein Deipe_1581 [Deinococcus peraridilitoris DSM 19664]
MVQPCPHTLQRIDGERERLVQHLSPEVVAWARARLAGVSCEPLAAPLDASDFIFEDVTG